MKEAVLHNSTKQLTAANAKATMVSMGVSVLVVREVDPAERLSEASIRARRSCILRDRVSLTVKPLTSAHLRGWESDKGWAGGHTFKNEDIFAKTEDIFAICKSAA